MGVFLIILDNQERICPKCGKKLIPFGGFIEWQSKDIHGEYARMNLGDPVTLEHTGILFKAEPFDAVWTGLATCLNREEDGKLCYAPIECDIIIKKGIITEIKNLRIWDMN